MHDFINYNNMFNSEGDCFYLIFFGGARPFSEPDYGSCSAGYGLSVPLDPVTHPPPPAMANNLYQLREPKGLSAVKSGIGRPVSSRIFPDMSRRSCGVLRLLRGEAGAHHLPQLHHLADSSCSPCRSRFPRRCLRPLRHQPRPATLEG